MGNGEGKGDLRTRVEEVDPEVPQEWGWLEGVQGTGGCGKQEFG